MCGPDTEPLADVRPVKSQTRFLSRAASSSGRQTPSEAALSSQPSSILDFERRHQVQTMRRNLTPAELGDLLELALNAILALHRADGSILLTPVWHRWTGTHFVFYIPAGDRKPDMLIRDPRISFIVADSEHPFRTMQVEGAAKVRTDGFREVAREIAARYVAAHDPDAEVDDYIGPEDGVWVEVIAERVRAWDYADAVYS